MQGQFKDCECSAPADAFLGIFKEDQVRFILQVSDAFDKASKARIDSQPQVKPDCQEENFSDIPSKVFGGDKNSVYGHFCDSWAEGRDLKMTVDAAGNDRKPAAGLTRRTPPPNPDTCSHFNFDLGFAPATDKSKKCALNCKDLLHDASMLEHRK